jgi:pentatricopeptide repeat protein
MRYAARRLLCTALRPGSAREELSQRLVSARRGVTPIVNELVRVLSHDMDDASAPPVGSDEFITMLAALRRSGEGRRAVTLHDQMIALGITPTLETYTTAISACRGDGMWKTAVQLLDESIDYAHFDSDTKLYNAVIFSFASGAHSSAVAKDKAVALVKRMEHKSRGTVPEPDVASYTAAMRACINAGAPLDALELYERSRRAESAQIDDRALATVFDACADAGRWSDALGYLDELDAPCATAFEGALQACAKCNRWKECVALLTRMAEAGVELSATHSNAVLAACARRGRAEEALGVLSLLESQHPALVDGDAVLSVMRAVARDRRAGTPEERLAPLRAMLERLEREPLSPGAVEPAAARSGPAAPASPRASTAHFEAMLEVSRLLCTVTFHANPAHNLTRSP